MQLWEKKDAGYATLSGGQKQRLALALALINDPQMLFLDEPTTGLDPQVRLEIRDLIEELRAEKRTILMTTHYIEEAERLCDRVAIIDAGRIIAIGSPRELQEKSANQSGVEITLGQPLPPNEIAGMARSRSAPSSAKIGATSSVSSSRPARTLVEMVKWIDAQGIELDDVHLKRPTLEDVFIELTGKKSARLTMKAFLALLKIDLKLALRKPRRPLLQLLLSAHFLLSSSAQLSTRIRARSFSRSSRW